MGTIKVLIFFFRMGKQANIEGGDLQRLNYNPRKKRYQIWTSGVKGNWIFDRYATSVLIKNFSQLLEKGAKVEGMRTEHLFLTGEILDNPDVSQLILDRDTNIIYFPKKHDGFIVECRGKGYIDANWFKGSDIYCGISAYKSKVMIVKGYRD